MFKLKYIRLLRTELLYSVHCTEQGTRQYCRHNMTMFSGHKDVCYCNISIFVVAAPSRHRDLNIFRFFSGLWGSITFLASSLSRSKTIVTRAQLWFWLPCPRHPGTRTVVSGCCGRLDGWGAGRPRAAATGRPWQRALQHTQENNKLFTWQRALQTHTGK